MTSDSSVPVSQSLNTSASLLEGVRARDGEAWRRLAILYGPMVYRWARKAGLQAQDAQDVVQIVFLDVVSDIGKFRRSRPGDSFRGWLWTISRHKILDRFRERRQQGQAIGGSDERFREIAIPSFGPDEEDDDMCRLRHRALALLRERFESHIWEAFLRTVVHGDRPINVAEDLGVSVATVYRAKCLVLTRLRMELEGL